MGSEPETVLLRSRPLPHIAFDLRTSEFCQTVILAVMWLTRRSLRCHVCSGHAQYHHRSGSQHITRVAFLLIFPEIADLYGHVLGRGQERAGVLGSASALARTVSTGQARRAMISQPGTHAIRDRYGPASHSSAADHPRCAAAGIGSGVMDRLRPETVDRRPGGPWYPDPVDGARGTRLPDGTRDPGERTAPYPEEASLINPTTVRPVQRAVS